MFDAVEMKGQGRKVIQALALVVNGLDRADELLPVIEALGRRHAATAYQMRTITRSAPP